MFVQIFASLLFMIISVKSESGSLPTATDIQTSLETCQISDLSFLSPKSSSSAERSDVRCFTKELGLWSDDEGFATKRFVKFLKKHNQPLEISIVIEYCNKTNKHTDLDKWANEAYYCFARGRMGQWINDYVKNAYKKKVHE